MRQSKSMRYCLDTSALNRLHDDPDREAIVTGMLTGASFRISAYNVIESAKTSDVARRQSLVRLLNELSQNKRPLDRPNTLIRAVARGYAHRRRGEDVTLTVNEDPNLEGLWSALNEPEAIQESERCELFDWAQQWEGDYDEIVAADRDKFQSFFEEHPEQRPRSAAATVRSFMKHEDQIYSFLVSPIYQQETGEILSREEYDEMMEEPMWSLYLAGYAYALHNRAVRPTRFSRHRNAGGIDLGQAVYLRLCDRFITNDVAQYRGLRFLNRFNRSKDYECEVWMYQSFRGRLLLLA